jgi:acyl transferase domain-containing protein/SAM-dependent methyltransferase/acyl carrier protein
MAELSSSCRAHGLRVTPVHVNGRFHSSVHDAAVEKIIEFAKNREDMQLPTPDKLQVPVRCTIDGTVIREGALIRHMLENTLSKQVNWHTAVQTAAAPLSKDAAPVVGFVGAGNHVPASLVPDPRFTIVSLGEVATHDAAFPPSSHSPRVNGIDHSEYPPNSIAIVGMAGRFPGADTLDELWQLLLSGKVMVQPAPVDRLGLPRTGDHANTKWWGNFLNDPDAFDHRFFKKSSREAIAWDPQQRVLLEVVYEALESAGYFCAGASKQPQDYGCYMGAVMNNYYDNVSCHPATAYATLGTSRCFISGCMSHYFGWTGPALSIDTACSSSLVAINTACRAIWSGECSRAVAGGTNMITSPFDYQNLHAAGFLSPNGQCKPFDAAADGYCRGEGVGVIVLKKLEDALSEHDNILGVIVGSAANQNHNLSHITVPHSGSQVDLYQKVMAAARVDWRNVSYVEAHGTGTGVGDPVEYRSIRDAFAGPSRQDLLHFGSIKGNIGHTEATAGVAGLIKVLLMMQHRKIPQQASHVTMNPKIQTNASDHMAISKGTINWAPPTRVAMVNSYGAAGSNSAVLVREYQTKSVKAPKTLAKYPIILSAGSKGSLSAYSQKLTKMLREYQSDGTSVHLGDLAFNLADRANHSLSCILTTTVSNLSELETELDEVGSGKNVMMTSTPKPVVLVFGGQESEFVGISESIYQSSALFRHHLDKCDAVLLTLGYEGIYPAVFQQTAISSLITLHSALFAVQYASAQAWMDAGLEVSAVVGHSFGQLTALCISGVLSLEDALALVAGRASIMLKYWGAESGAMMFLQADQSTVTELVKTLKDSNGANGLEVACYNGPKSHVVVGTPREIEELDSLIAGNTQHKASIRTKRLQVTHGFHSRFTEPLLPYLEDLAQSLEWKSSTIHLETCDEASSFSNPDYTLLTHHTRFPVFFQNAVDRLVQRFPQATWLEAGRGSSVSQLVRGCLADNHEHTVLSPQLTSSNAQDSLTSVTIELWKAGYSVQYWPFHRTQRDQYTYLGLPPYQFERTRHWLPFTGRGSQKEEAEALADTKPMTYELLTFIHYAGDNENEAVFAIAPQSDRFKSMLAGHVMAGQSLAPASLYFEVVARAALFLAKDTESTIYVPTMEDLTMKSPIGLNTDVDIRLCLKRLDASHPSWSFSITTQAKGGRRDEPLEQSTGRVRLTLRKDKQAAQVFKRFESLTGLRRCEEINAHPKAERMSGNHIYRAFNHIVHYTENFRGIKEVSCVGFEATGKVMMLVDPERPTDERLTDTPMTDSFMQFAGFLVNYFNNPSLEDVLVCHKIEHIEIGDAFDPDAKEWIVYSNMTQDDNDDASADAYVFDPRTKKMVMAAFGFRFSKMSQSLLARMLKSVNRNNSSTEESFVSAADHDGNLKPIVNATAPVKQSSSERARVLKILHDVTDVSLEQLQDDSLSLEDLGVDSLMATEILNDIRVVLGLTIDLTTFLFFADLKEFVVYVDTKLGLGSEEGETITPDEDTPYTSDGVSLSTQETPPNGTAVPPAPIKPTLVLESRPSIPSAYDSFRDIRFNYDQLAVGTKAAGFWSDVYPDQAKLVLAYVVEAFTQLDCDLGAVRPGGAVRDIHDKALPAHRQLVRQLYRVLEDARLITAVNGGFYRTDVPIDTSPAEVLYQAIIPRHPESANVHKLVKVIGTQLASCLVGKTNGLQLIFGDREHKQTLEDMYANWPLLRTPTLVLGDFMLKAFTSATGSGKFRILEIGAGTGGTTKYLISLLQANNIPFEYTFTDISSSLVGAAKKTFKNVDGMIFEVLDVEKPPPESKQGEYHVIIATNCIHATRNLDVSLKHVRQMLREDGALTLVEITKNMFWLDVVVGLFEGWWLFEDGRTHALIDELKWQSLMKKAGFQSVLWSDGNTPEAATVRVIGAFPKAHVSETTQGMTVTKTSPKAALETVVYKKIGDQEVHADVYYPLDPPAKKLPVALMIHGGSHIIFSRKDIRPPQTRLLLERGFLPVSLDHRLCPEVKLAEGPMVDVCDALDWARNVLPQMKLNCPPGMQIDGERVVVVGWSSGGQLAMSLAWTAPQRGLRPPEAILAFYCPTDYEDECKCAKSHCVLEELMH